MLEARIGGWLDELASEAPAPGGGAVAALDAAVAAGLVEMVTSLTIGKPRYADHEATMLSARTEATTQRARAVRLADEDAAAFTAVMAAYRLPRSTDKERAERAARIEAALVTAAEVQVRTSEVAGHVLALVERIGPGANVNVLSDVAVAAASARAALESAVVNIEINRRAITNESRREQLTAAAGRIEADISRAAAIVRAVRARISG